jgi:imidazole glycerol-phosphate synthase subunit HisH
LEDPAFVYYVHSFYCELGEHTIATTHYVHDFAALMHRDNFYAMQAHPEKSGAVGERILRNFLDL